MNADKTAYSRTRKEELESRGRTGNWIFIETLEATDAEEKCLFLVVGLRFSIQGELLTRMSHGDDGRSGYEQVTGETPDISEWLDFEFYDLVRWDETIGKMAWCISPCRIRFVLLDCY
jgi:hypothetical protein